MTLMKTDDAGDSEDLQALFDNIAASANKPVPPPPPAEPNPSGDNDDLQALFDSVASQAAPDAGVEVAAASVAAPGTGTEEVAFNRLGHLARQLHDNLRELGYDRMLADAAEALPDTRQRLTYIAQMTEQAASRVLNATDIAQPIQEELAKRSTDLSARWDKMFANQLSVDEFKLLAADTRGYFHAAPAKLNAASAQLTEIMMAQDFQDLTGQVIKKVVELANNLEQQMLSILIEVMPEDRKVANESLMNGPVVNAAGRTDVVTDQSQVDDLLESLGF